MSFRGRGSGGGGMRPHRRGGRQGAAVELTPLIDITFQLLIFFLLTATFQSNPSFRVKLPKAKNDDVTQETKALTVSISSDGRFELDRKEVDPRELELRLCRSAQDESVSGVNIRADEETSHRDVVIVMDLAKRCGLERLGILHGR